MITRKLSAADMAAYERGLLSDHKMRVLVQVLDLNHRVMGEATGVVLSGSVDIDVEQVAGVAAFVADAGVPAPHG